MGWWVGMSSTCQGLNRTLACIGGWRQGAICPVSRRCDSAGPARVHPSPGGARSRPAHSADVRAVPLCDGAGPLASMFAALKVNDFTCSTFPLALHGLNSSLTPVGSHLGSTLRSCAERCQRRTKEDAGMHWEKNQK